MLAKTPWVIIGFMHTSDRLAGRAGMLAATRQPGGCVVGLLCCAVLCCAVLWSAARQFCQHLSDVKALPGTVLLTNTPTEKHHAHTHKRV